jgi:dUTP pyrophosphatase
MGRYIAIIEMGHGVGRDDTAKIQLIDKLGHDHILITHSSNITFKESSEKINDTLSKYDIDSIVSTPSSTNQMILENLSKELSDIKQLPYSSIARLNDIHTNKTVTATSIVDNGTSGIFGSRMEISLKQMEIDLHPFKINIGVKKMNKDAEIPKYNKHGDSGFDLVAMETKIIIPGETIKIPIGLAFEIPPGLELQLRPRSGLSAKTKLRVIFGTIDSNYRGEVTVVVDNNTHPTWVVDRQTFEVDQKMVWTISNLENKPVRLDTPAPQGSIIIHKGQRISQGILAMVYKGLFTEKEELSETDRGADGFGSSGV